MWHEGHTCSPWLKDQESDGNKNCPGCRAQDDVVCTCPDWWFPQNRREKLRLMPHGFGGMLSHYKTCAKTVIK